MSIAVVVPTIRPELFLSFLEAWKSTFEKHDVTLYILEDHAEKTFTIPKQSFNVIHYCWKDIDDALGDKAWIIPRQTCAIKSFGYYAAYKAGFDRIMVLDDDCMPPEYPEYNDVLAQHNGILTIPQFIEPWFDVGYFVYPGKHARQMRGFPYQYRSKTVPVVWSVGGWDNNPDFDGLTQAQKPVEEYKFKGMTQAVPKGFGCTYCGMNTMFDAQIIPASYFMLNGPAWGVDRWDDIWAGYFIKKVCDQLNLATVISGFPTIVHTRASNVLSNIKKEASGMATNEVLWDHVKGLELVGTTPKDLYIDLARKLDAKLFPTEEYGNKLKEAMEIWANLF